jgi:hypothetical protein
MQLTAYGASDTGRVRAGNEDRFLVGTTLFAVADGLVVTPPAKWHRRWPLRRSPGWTVVGVQKRPAGHLQEHRSMGVYDRDP